MISERLGGLLEGNHEPEPEPCDLTIDEALHLMQNERRRYVVEFMDILGPMELEALADAVSAVTDSTRKAVYIALYQSHLPELDKYNVIDLGERGHSVEPGEHFDACADFVQDVQTKFKSDSQHPAEFTFDELDDIAGGDRA